MVDTFEVGYVTRVLAMTGGNISEAARLARKHRRAFWEIMKKHGLQVRDESRTPVAQELIEGGSQAFPVGRRGVADQLLEVGQAACEHGVFTASVVEGPTGGRGAHAG